MRNARRTALAAALVLAAAPALSATFNDRTAFKAAVGTVVESTNLFSDYTVTAAAGSSLNNSYGTFTDKFGANPYVVINGVENFDVQISYASAMYGFGMDVYEPTSTATFNGCNATCIDSTFEITLFRGATQIDQVLLNPLDDVLSFFGITSASAFDRVRIRETVGGIDNEMFGNFISAPIPLPAGLPLLLGGLGGLALLRRTRR